MSLRATLLNFVMRRFKGGFSGKSPVQTVAKLRHMMRHADRAKAPKWAEVKSDSLNGVACEWLRYKNAAAQSDRLIIYFHGGAFVCGGPATHRHMGCRLSQASAATVLMVDYRLAPEHPYPAALADSLTVYRYLLDKGYEPSRMVIAGDSAGGNLTLACLAALRAESLPLPGCAICVSPWADLSHSGQSIRDNAQADPMLPLDMLTGPASLYARDLDLKDPRISPVFEDFTDFPPLQLIVGSTEILLDDSRRIAQQARSAGVAVELDIWHNMPHAFTVMSQFLPEARQAIDSMAGFVERRIS